MKCLILAGGSGDRLWPLSRRNYPKQFIEIKENRSFLQETILRNMSFCEEFLIVTNEKYRYVLENQIQAFQGLKYRCFYEAVSRGTLVPVALISMLMNPSELLLVTAADLAVGTAGYRESVLEGMEFARAGHITIFGLEAKTTSARYGYIHHLDNHVLHFQEKPNVSEACLYAGRDDYDWNSGMFITTAGDYLYQLDLCRPDIYQECKRLAYRIKAISQEITFEAEDLESFPVLSVEKGIFEHAKDLRMVEARFSWGDMDELEDVFPFTRRDEKNVILKDCENVRVLNRGKRQLVAGCGLENLTVINTEDAVYIAKAGHSSDTIKEFMEEYQEEYGSWFQQDNICYRSWGHFETLRQEDGYFVRKVTVYSGKMIYAHEHQLRDEHWLILSGDALIDMGGKEQIYHANESLFVGRGIRHQVVNPSEKDLMIIEIGFGEQLKESEMQDTLSVKGRQQEAQIPADSLIRLEPAFKDYLWGGVRLKSVYHKQCDYERIAESWELSAHPAGQSIVAEGRCKGMPFGEYLHRIGKAALGWKSEVYEEFPILMKLIEAKEPLSLQVHPDDAFAMQNEGEYGKNEMWYIIDCEEGAFLYCGFKKKVSQEQVIKAIKENKLESLLKRRRVRPGDTIFIPAGTVHAIGAGILLCEIQQNSNSTYRIYDYERTDKYGKRRELHIEKALQVLDLNEYRENAIPRQPVLEYDGYKKELLVECKYFEAVKYIVEKEAAIELDEASFAGIIILSGEAGLSTEDKEAKAKAGDAFFVPAGKRMLQITGNCVMLITRV